MSISYPQKLARTIHQRTHDFPEEKNQPATSRNISEFAVQIRRLRRI
jgi:hypothetical protein